MNIGLSMVDSHSTYKKYGVQRSSDYSAHTVNDRPNKIFS